MKTLITLILLAFLPMAAHAQGAARAGSGPLRAAYSHVAVVVDGDVARTTLTQVFVNDLPQPVEASFSFPLPADATVTGFAEWRDGRKVDAKATGKEEAREAYDRAVDRGERAAHGESDEEEARFRMTLSAIPAGGSRRVELRYLQTLSALGSERTYAFPRGGEAPAATLLDVEVQLAGDRPLVAVATPNQPDARVSAAGATRRVVRLSRSGVGLARDLVVRWRQDSEPLDLAARAVLPAPGTPGYVEARFAFNDDPLGGRVEGRDVVVVIDTSLSMAGLPLKRAREGALALIDGMAAADRVEVIAFADEVRSAFGGLSQDAAGARAFLKGLKAGGRSDLEGALAAAAERLAGSPDAVLVLLTDGQPTARSTGADPFGLDLDSAAFAQARVVVGHFNYPHRTAALASIFPNVSVRFIPDGPAGEEAVLALARLAVAPVIEDLSVELLGDDVHLVHGALPARLAVGEHVRLLGRVQGEAYVRVTGTLYGRDVEMTAPVVWRSGGDDLGLPVEWARLRVADLDAEWRALKDAPTREVVAAEIRGLGTQFSLATRFTGYVMNDSLDPDHIKPGDPEIRVAAPASAKAVFAVLPWGEVVACSWDDEEGLWLGRFLVPRGVEDGLYRARVFVEGQGGAACRGALFFRVDSEMPPFELTREGDDGPVAAGDTLALVARPVRPEVPAGKGGDRIDPDPLDVKQVQVSVGGEVWILTREDAADVWSGKVPVELPPGKHAVKLVVMDYARNTTEARLWIEVQ
ncbi:MAG: VWA domain-containing protein [Myxococcales bacterium]|nr:VWA domain-containing protein [Myxococcales bacterium]